jgi:hypothetical protein
MLDLIIQNPDIVILTIVLAPFALAGAMIALFMVWFVFSNIVGKGDPWTG